MAKLTLSVKAGQRLKVFSRKFSSVPMTYEFDAEPAGTEKVSGIVEVEITQTLFRKKQLKLPLQEHNVIKASMWDTFMDVYVTPDVDVQVEVPKRSMSAKPVIIGLILVVLALASVVMVTAFNQ